METRDIIGQEIIYFEAVFKVSKLLDQFCDGLRDAGILKAVRAFPCLFICLFTYTGDVSSESVLEALIVDEKVPKVLVDFLTKYILEADEKGNIYVQCSKLYCNSLNRSLF